LANVVAAERPGAITPQGAITPIKLATGEVMMLHTLIDFNNAHPVETISFFKPSVSGPAEHIPFEMDGDYQPFLFLRSGADCAISGIRAFRNRDGLQLMYALRKGGWIEKQAVTFVVFELTKNAEDAPGIPRLYFRQQKKFVSRQTYCDVNQALEKEASQPDNRVN
jgi:hypothetical protein